MNINEEKENKQILNAYRGILRSMKSNRSKEETKQIRKAFDVAVDAHKHMRRKSGEPYILHPIAVARICSDEIGLGPTAVISALLHDTVEDTELTLADIEKIAKEKMSDLNAIDVKGAVNMVKGSAVSMGMEIVS